jgi:methylenetetrahydrofolate--tRNA-(uracil-5-)-methyltransferase
VSSSTELPVWVVGGGLAGSEAAWQLGSRGVPVVLWEMRPERPTPAHSTGDFAELVCSNTLGSKMPHTAPGIFKDELQQLGSLIVAAGWQAHVPAGGALGVDRAKFSAAIEQALGSLPSVTVRRQELTRLPAPDEARVIVATGPLTSPALAEQITAAADTVDMDVAFWADRYGDDEGGDYLNLPLDKAQYEAFIDALTAGEVTPSKDFEKEVYFGGCQPIEAIAATGRESLRFGPMKPVGLRVPSTGHRAWAVVQLRRETRDGAAMNLVGFQTKLRYGEQTRIFRTIPGLAEAEFLRLGSVHRNTFLNTPRLLDGGLRLRTLPHVSFAGQIVGCEGYTESSAMGLWAALSLLAERDGRPLPGPPRTSMFGALLAYLREADPSKFQPMNVNFGLLPPDPLKVRKKDRKERRVARGKECVAAFSEWAVQNGVRRAPPSWPPSGTP